MILVLAWALAVAAVNVAVGRLLELRWGRGRDRFAWVQAAGFLFRFVVIFGAAHALWRRHQRAYEVVVFIVAGAVLQLVGQVYFSLRRHA